MNPESSILRSSDAFGKFFSEYRGHFVNIAASYVRDLDVAKDIVTDSFVYLWERRAELTEETNIKGYMYCCVRNRCNSYLRSKLSHLKIQGELTKEMQWQIRSSLHSLGSNEISDKLFHKEMIDIFQAELARMPALTREVFLASRSEELTYRKIADRFGIPVRRVTSEIQTALQCLRRALKASLPICALLLLLER